MSDVAVNAVYDAKRSIEEFLDATAAKQPAPGGGSIAALAGALAAAVGEMALNYSVGRKTNSSEDEAKLSEALVELHRARNLMLQLMVEDQAAFSALSAARKAAAGEGDKDPVFAAALLACIRIPQAIAGTGAATLELCGTVAPIANKFLLSDLAVCAELSMATVRCAIYNIHVNLADISDASERASFTRSTSELLARAGGKVRQVMPAISARLS